QESGHSNNSNDDDQDNGKEQYLKKGIVSARGSTTSKRSSGNRTVTALMYRMKKWQYVFYKHALFHALNMAALENDTMLSSATPWFRSYWWLLNLSYVMEFF